ncbi:Cytochrome P450 monooxygenase FCK2 [Colletotrichum spinosum]|uniref:Cytochrome P450 monooxygenase FCK2 n=1 Tax=Colletotrichum spinosum TaxID=1347390 RepID=A0A4R8PN59_9PEZI|nr:Cytochrome P450 monooxygenase FCK2 [Colletotrichum spinosum]
MLASDILLSHEALGLSFLIGVTLHVFVFRHGEWDLEAQRIITVFSLALAAVVTAAVATPLVAPKVSGPVEPARPIDAIRAAGVLFGVLTAGIYSSMMRYRGYFHRLRRFPGPFLARFTNLYVTCRVWNRLHLNEDVKKLHEKYGDVVRVGPTEISINKPGAISAVFLETDCYKGPWHNLNNLHPMVSMQMVRDKEAHARRRKAWEHGFTSKDPLRDYEPRVLGYTNQLLAGIGARAGDELNASRWLNFFQLRRHGRVIPGPRDVLNLHGACILITVAGSDAVAAVLSCLFTELARHPRESKKLQGEIDEYLSRHETPEHVSLSKLRYLQACIDESLRLHPPVPSGVQRVTPPEGLQVDDVWLPGDTRVFVPSYTQHRGKPTRSRASRFFAEPDDFIPERWWLDGRPELVRNAAVYVPFSTGHDVCTGKQPGLMETRLVVSAVVHGFDVRFAEGQTGDNFLAESRDTGTLTVGPLNLVFTPRKGLEVWYLANSTLDVAVEFPSRPGRTLQDSHDAANVWFAVCYESSAPTELMYRYIIHESNARQQQCNL